MIQYSEYKNVYLTPDIPDEAIEWRNNPAVWKWCRQNTLIDMYHHKAWEHAQSSNPNIKMFGVATGFTSIGVCGFTSIDRLNRSAEFSLYIDPDEQRKGYGKRALQTLIRHGFEDWGFNRIWGETFDGNPALKTFLEIGLTTEGTLRESYFKKGKFINSFIVSILASEFKVHKIPELDLV